MPAVFVLGLAAWTTCVGLVVAFVHGASPSPSPSPSPFVSSRRRTLRQRVARRPTGTRSLGARLAGYGIGESTASGQTRFAVTPKVPSMRAASGSLLVRGVCGPVPSGCYVGIRTPTLRLYPPKSGLLSTGGFAADTGDAFMGDDARDPYPWLSDRARRHF